MSRIGKNSGFTFIEVMVAMLIFVMTIVTAITIVDGSVRATRDAREITVAAWLLQNVMTELEAKIETEGFEKGCEKKKGAKFQAPHDSYAWTSFCNEIDFNLPQAAARLMNTGGADSGDEVEKEDAIQKLILQLAGDYIGKSMRELHAEITWMQGKTKRQIAATTHVVRMDQPLTLPSFGASPGGDQ